MLKYVVLQNLWISQSKHIQLTAATSSVPGVALVVAQGCTLWMLRASLALVHRLLASQLVSMSSAI